MAGIPNWYPSDVRPLTSDVRPPTSDPPKDGFASPRPVRPLADVANFRLQRSFGAKYNREPKVGDKVITVFLDISSAG